MFGTNTGLVVICVWFIFKIHSSCLSMGKAEEEEDESLHHRKDAENARVKEQIRKDAENARQAARPESLQLEGISRKIALQDQLEQLQVQKQAHVELEEYRQAQEVKLKMEELRKELVVVEDSLAKLEQLVTLAPPPGFSPGRGKADLRGPPPPTPDGFICAISCELMVDPVICTDGHTYERATIQEWLSHHNTSPKTNEELASKALIQNHNLRAAIAEWHKLQ